MYYSSSFISSACTSASSALASTGESFRFIVGCGCVEATTEDRGMGTVVSFELEGAGGGVRSRGAIPALWRTSRMDMNLKKLCPVDLAYPEVGNKSLSLVLPGLATWGVPSFARFYFQDFILRGVINFHFNYSNVFHEFESRNVGSDAHVSIYDHVNTRNPSQGMKRTDQSRLTERN